jgi:hypothetical protein
MPHKFDCGKDCSCAGVKVYEFMFPAIVPEFMFVVSEFMYISIESAGTELSRVYLGKI